VTAEAELLAESAEDLFENAPCGYVTTRMDGTIVKLNRTYEEWTGLRREDAVGGRRFQDMLTVGGRIYYETHCRPLLHMQGTLREIAVDLIRADGSLLPALISSTVRTDDEGRPQFIRTTVFDATDRRRYEQELLQARQREHEIAQLLQRSLLAGKLPAAPGLTVGVSYRPAESGLDVGGDWYDAFWLDDEGETVALVLGDVVGRGIGAAATMGQLRSAMRALASARPSPAELLSALDRYGRRHAVGQMATALYADLNVTTGRLRYACAGHPPPALIRAGEPPCLLWGGRSAPLAMFIDDSTPRAEARCRLQTGDTLVLYTDGLIERRMESITVGFDRLLATLASHRAEPTTTLAGGVVHAMHHPGHRDDVCLLAARLATEPSSG
jgi:phosphoserine phosphatase RsbU/P